MWDARDFEAQCADRLSDLKCAQWTIGWWCGCARGQCSVSVSVFHKLVSNHQGAAAAAPDCLFKIDDIFGGIDRLTVHSEKLEKFIDSPDGERLPMKNPMKLLKTSSKTVTDGWRNLEWVPRSMFDQNLFPEHLTDIGLQMFGFGHHGWRTGIDDPFLGIGMFVRVVTGTVCAYGRAVEVPV